ncbi:hypothetical protein D3C78_1277370 [compost metagenome]
MFALTQRVLRCHDLDVYVGVERSKTMHARDEPQGRKGIVRMQADSLPILRPAKLLREKIDGVDITRDDVEQFLSFGRQFDAAMLAPDKSHAQLILQLPHLIADGRLGQSQRCRRSREAAAAGDIGENAHPSEIKRPVRH